MSAAVSWQVQLEQHIILLLQASTDDQLTNLPWLWFSTCLQALDAATPCNFLRSTGSYVGRCLLHAFIGKLYSSICRAHGAESICVKNTLMLTHRASWRAGCVCILLCINLCLHHVLTSFQLLLMYHSLSADDRVGWWS